MEKDKQKAMENSEKAPVEKLAADLDDFAFDFDFYHYKDSVENREQAVEALKEQIQAGDIQPIREWLQVAVEESEGESAEKAAELIVRLDTLVKEQKLLSSGEKQFGIYQITARDPEHDYRFMNLDFVKRHGMEVNRADYELVYTAPLTEKDTLEAIYERFNIQCPADFTGHSLSVSDVVVLNDGSTVKAYYVDSIGFAELSDFFKERNTLYNKNFTERDGGILETDGDKSVQEAMTELLTEFGCNAEEGRVMDAAELREQADTVAEQQAEALKEKLAAEKPTPEATISFYVAECAEFPVMGEFHDNLTLEQALEVYDKIPAERMNGIKSIGFSLEDGSIYSGMFDLMVGGEVQADVVNHIQHYRESPLVQKAISDIKTLLEKRQASKELEERPNTRQSVREALKNRKKAQEQQSNQEQAKPKKAKKKGEMEL